MIQLHVQVAVAVAVIFKKSNFITITVHEGRDEAIASGGQIFGGEIEVLKEYSLWLFLGL